MNLKRLGIIAFSQHLSFVARSMDPFFFSSRRRHTRWNCDCSDVCSSDLIASGMRRQCSRTDENAPGLSIVPLTQPVTHRLPAPCLHALPSSEEVGAYESVYP